MEVVDVSGSTETDGKMVSVTGVGIFVKFKKEAFAGASMPCRGFKVNGETPKAYSPRVQKRRSMALRTNGEKDQNGED